MPVKAVKVYVYPSFYPFTSYEYLLICILDKNYYTPNAENVQEYMLKRWGIITKSVPFINLFFLAFVKSPFMKTYID